MSVLSSARGELSRINGTGQRAAAFATVALAEQQFVANLIAMLNSGMITGDRAQAAREFVLNTMAVRDE